MNDSIVDLENKSAKLLSFNKHGNFDLENIQTQMKNTIKDGIEHFNQF